MATLLASLVAAGSLTACGGGFSGSAAPQPTNAPLRSYVALGDGFTAAPDTGPTVGDDGCLRSESNYPALVAEKLGIQKVRDVSCTHAGTDALTGTFKPANGRPAREPQLDAVDPTTDLVSIGVGIEDRDLLHEMFRICLDQPCGPGTTYYTDVLDQVTQAGDAVTSAIRSVQTKAPGAFIVVIGYPRLTPPPQTGCRSFPPQDPRADRDLVNYVLDDLNAHLRSAAQQTGAAYVDVAALSQGHELCSAKPWVHDMADKPGRAVAYHPLEAEQEAIATQLVEQVKQR